MKRHRRQPPGQAPSGQAANPKVQRPGSAPASPATASDGTTVHRKRLLGALLFALVVIAYLPVATNGGFIWEDEANVTANPLLTTSDGWHKIWFSHESPSQYFPLVYSMFRIERHFWGVDATGYHLVNVVLHGINALLVWQVLRRLKIPGCWLAAALFAMHPVNVESVAWITERKNVLSLFFCLLAVLAWLRLLDGTSKRPGVVYLAAIAFQMLALFSNAAACTLPAALLLVLWWKRLPINGRRIAQIVPFVALGIAMGLAAVWPSGNETGPMDNVQPLTLAERFIVAGHAFWFYLGKLIWPANLTFNYPRWALQPSNPLAYGWLVALVGLGVAVWYARRRFGRGPETATLFYVATLSPVLGFIMLATFRWSFVADHFQYAASIGPLTLAAAGITIGIKKLSAERQALARVAVPAALLLTLGVMVARQCSMYANNETLWRATLQRNPASWMAHVNLGKVLLEKKQFYDAFDHYRMAEELNPNDSMIACNIANACLQAGDPDLAVSYFEKAVWLQPRYFDALNSLASVQLQMGQMDEAILRFQTVLQLRPNDKDARHSLGVALLQKSRPDDAIVQFKRVLEQDPTYLEGRKSLGNAYLHKGQIDAAIAEYERAVALQPDNVATHDDYGAMLLAAGRVPAAIEQFKRVIELQPQYTAAYAGLNRAAWLMATSSNDKIRNGAQALSLAQQINRLFNDRNPFILQTLAAAQAENGKYTDAATTAQRALQLADSQNSHGLGDALWGQFNIYLNGRPFRDRDLRPFQ